MDGIVILGGLALVFFFFVGVAQCFKDAKDQSMKVMDDMQKGAVKPGNAPEASHLRQERLLQELADRVDNIEKKLYELEIDLRGDSVEIIGEVKDLYEMVYGVNGRADKHEAMIRYIAREVSGIGTSQPATRQARFVD